VVIAARAEELDPELLKIADHVSQVAEVNKGRFEAGPFGSTKAGGLPDGVYLADAYMECSWEDHPPAAAAVLGRNCARLTGPRVRSEHLGQPVLNVGATVEFFVGATREAAEAAEARKVGPVRAEATAIYDAVRALHADATGGRMAHLRDAATGDRGALRRCEDLSRRQRAQVDDLRGRAQRLPITVAYTALQLAVEGMGACVSCTGSAGVACQAVTEMLREVEGALPPVPGRGSDAGRRGEPSRPALGGAEQATTDSVVGSSGETVVVRVSAQPAEAEIRVDGAKVSNPYEGRFRRGGPAVRVQVSAPGYAGAVRSVSLDADQDVRIVLTRSATSASREPPATTSTASDSPSPHLPPGPPPPPDAAGHRPGIDTNNPFAR
jgi:hypothetical protein